MYVYSLQEATAIILNLVNCIVVLRIQSTQSLLFYKHSDMRMR